MNLFHRFFLFLLILITAVNAAQAAELQKQSPRAVKTADGKFAIVPPDGWEVDTSGKFDTQMIFTKKLVSGLNVNINLITEKSGALTLQEYKDLMIDGAKKALSGFSLASEKKIEAGGIEGWELVATHEYGGSPFQMKQAIFIESGIAYVLTYTATKADYQQYADDFDRAVRSAAFAGSANRSEVVANDGSFAIVPPEGWTVSDKAGPMIIIGQSADGVRANITTGTEKCGEISAQTYANAALKHLKGALSDFSLISSNPAKMNGVEAHAVVVGCKISGLDVVMKQYYAVVGGTAYIFSLTTAKSALDANSAAFDKAMQTVRFIKQP